MNARSRAPQPTSTGRSSFSLAVWPRSRAELLGHPVERREREPQQLRAVAVVLDAAGVVAGWRLADPIVGLLLTVASVVVLHDAAGRPIGDSWTPSTLWGSRTGPRDVTCGFRPDFRRSQAHGGLIDDV